MLSVGGGSPLGKELNVIVIVLFKCECSKCIEREMRQNWLQCQRYNSETHNLHPPLLFLRIFPFWGKGYGEVIEGRGNTSHPFLWSCSELKCHMYTGKIGVERIVALITSQRWCPGWPGTAPQLWWHSVNNQGIEKGSSCHSQHFSKQSWECFLALPLK